MKNDARRMPKLSQKRRKNTSEIDAKKYNGRNHENHKTTCFSDV